MKKIKAGSYKVGPFTIRKREPGGWIVFRGRLRLLTFVGLKYARVWCEQMAAR